MHSMTFSLLYFTAMIAILIISILGAFYPNPLFTSISGIGNLDTVNRSQDGVIENSETKKGLEIRPNKNIFRPGETVIITARNNGAEPLTFPDASLGLLIENIKTKESFGLISAQVLTSLEPGQSTSLEWDQHGLDGSQAKAGEYKVSVTTIPDQNTPPLSVNSYFQIRK
jgi:hypothetical protein